jgi:hypothetical protein
VRDVEQVLAMESICTAQAIWLQPSKPDARVRALGRGVDSAYRPSARKGLGR